MDGLIRRALIGGREAQQECTVINHYRYCPACGAKMDLEDEK